MDGVEAKYSSIHFLYQYCAKPLFFMCDPEEVHDHIVKMGIVLGSSRVGRSLVSSLFHYEHEALRQNILGIHFPNPIGLAAGFDKNAQLTDILPAVGFGFEEAGSITGESCAGNPRPRLWRLKKSKGLMIYYGLKNDGCQAIAERLSKKQFAIPVGMSVAKTNSPATVDLESAIEDYVKAYKAFINIGSYTTINISCPNAFGGEPFTDPAKLDALFTVLDTIPSKKPIFIKLSPDLETAQLDDLLSVLDHHVIHGIISSNLTKNRVNQKIIQDAVPDKGGMSGKIVEDLANKQLAYLYKKTKGKYVLIGCGGVFSARDAYAKIKMGASLVQLITGMIYEGPQLIGNINRELVALLKQDGYSSTSQAIGVDA